MEAVVSRYADRVDCWEIWNEPLVFTWRHPSQMPDKNGSPGMPLSAQETSELAATYAQRILEVVRNASKIIRKRDPQATLLSPGFEDFSNVPGGAKIHAFGRQIQAALLAGGMAKHVDGFCIHSYPAGFPGKAPLDDEPWRRSTGPWIRAIWRSFWNTTSIFRCTAPSSGFQLPREASAEDETAVALRCWNGCILAHQGFRLVAYFENSTTGADPRPI